MAAQHLVDASLSEDTKKSYNRIWLDFLNFCNTFLSISEASLPITVATLSLYMAYLHEKGFAASTLYTYNSAIAYFHKIRGLHDPYNSFYIGKLLQGAKRLRPSKENRLPITLAILHRLVTALDHTCSTTYNQILFKCMFLTAFYGLLRIGEITTNTINGKNTKHCLHLSDIEQATIGFRIKFQSYKHCKPHSVMSVVISPQPLHTYCPVHHLSNYLRSRGGRTSDILFVTKSGEPVSRSQFSEVLNRSLLFCGLPLNRFKGHSFRIGAATWLMQSGKSDAQIRNLGRWHSNAFLKYIRTDNP